jgi:hypothetical protein
LGAEGVDCTRRRHRRECEEGVSVWDNAEFAMVKARQIAFSRGRFLATLLVPDDGSIEIAKTFGPHHYTINSGGPESILSLVVGSAEAIPDLPEGKHNELEL